MTVGVKEELEEARVEIVMVGHVPPGALGRRCRGDTRLRAPIKRDQRDVRRAQAAETVPFDQ